MWTIRFTLFATATMLGACLDAEPAQEAGTEQTLVSSADDTPEATLDSASVPGSTPEVAQGSDGEQQVAPQGAQDTCRPALSSIIGASITGKVCWGRYVDPETGFDRKYGAVIGKVTDNAGDGQYAMFRIHYRHFDGAFWHTKTDIIKTTKGRFAPVTLDASWAHSGYKDFKDFWIQVCKQGSGHRTCDSTWH